MCNIHTIQQSAAQSSLNFEKGFTMLWLGLKKSLLLITDIVKFCTYFVAQKVDVGKWSFSNILHHTLACVLKNTKGLFTEKRENY